MNYHQKRAGQSTWEMAIERHKRRIWYSVTVIVIVLLIVLVALNPKLMKVGGVGSIELLIAARLIMNYSDVKDQKLLKEEKRAIRGAKGEEKIGSLLENLGEDYLLSIEKIMSQFPLKIAVKMVNFETYIFQKSIVIHDVESPYGNIDHIVISKQSGIFLIETKAHGGRVSVDQGRLLVNRHEPEKDFIAQALKNTYWLREKVRNVINVEIRIAPVLVFTNAFVERTSPIKGVTIINKKFLLNFLQRSNVKAQNSVVWENREKIARMLCA